MPVIKEYLMAGLILILIYLAYTLFSRGLEQGKNKCEAEQTIEQLKNVETTIKYRNVYIKENIKTRNISPNDKFNFLRSQCTDCFVDGK